MSPAVKLVCSQCGSGQVLLIRSWLLSHRLAVQAEIGQNRSIFPKRTKRPVSIVTNGVTEPAGSRECGTHRSGRGRAGRRLPPGNTAYAAIAAAQSLYGGTMLAGSPLRTALAPRYTLVCARHETAHPIDSFDKTGQRTLESFNSLAGRTDCNALTGVTIETGCRDSRQAGGASARIGFHARHNGRTCVALATRRACERSRRRRHSSRRLVPIASPRSIALARMCPSSLTSSNRTDTRFDTPDSSIVTP